jgi:hypothetical protein
MLTHAGFVANLSATTVAPSTTVFGRDTMGMSPEDSILEGRDMISPPPIISPSQLGSSRALIVGLALIPLVIVTIASIPALIILPFTPRGWDRCEVHVGRMAAWTAEILAHSRFRP